MYKALLLDLDETLCDTTGANNLALQAMAERAAALHTGIDGEVFSRQYLTGIYRDFTPEQAAYFLPINDEGAFRLLLIETILAGLGVDAPYHAETLQQCFDDTRNQCFGFFDGVADKLQQWRQHYQLVVITNGPEFSQLAKVAAVQLHDYVDHIIIGGQEPEQKPAASIFSKALTLANCLPSEAIHIGDSLTADIAGANNSGIRSLWISHGNQRTGDVVPTDTVATPQQFMAFIDGLAGQ
ncbi:Phosphoglycolate phosphatase [Sinobacterium norvegicum]|uniref:Phosphoglycolate phosphatase n=1 Tax=Sinobacterium norvegicum TaxID=1641715 RepID=A0ABM9AEY4_9GAMM|nr:HAD family hydrolase [Sinobacterium norvegicum]CAH0991751.1 Phosphoglycolate phosphatase [Sinobacterium norvegicum]